MILLDLAIVLLPKTKTEAATDGIAVAAVATPAWMTDLHGWLGVALQAFGIAWLAVQIIVKLHTTYGKKG